MADILISELARESGIPSSALRYYERVGLLTPVGRSAGGYRVYDERSVERLAFIGRAKRLGLRLDEINDLVSLWDDGPCAPGAHAIACAGRRQGRVPGRADRRAHEVPRPARTRAAFPRVGGARGSMRPGLRLRHRDRRRPRRLGIARPGPVSDRSRGRRPDRLHIAGGRVVRTVGRLAVDVRSGRGASFEP